MTSVTTVKLRVLLQRAQLYASLRDLLVPPPEPDAWFIDTLHLSAAGHEHIAAAVAPAVAAALAE